MTPASLKIYCDGGARGNPGPSASAFVVISNGKILFKDAKFIGKKTNNEAEYFGVIFALEWLSVNKKIISDNKISFYLDSELVTRQITGVYRVKGENLKPLIKKVNNLINEIGVEVAFYSIPRENNKIADMLLNTKIDENIG